ncbi:DnaJ subfamily C member protein 2 [Babesia gibsoni]|uniref:DnaJ subfamily C member protein 2 n=1 Tax=Babesia gibsoni TaxID=33632 RepID=A0AAD8LI26_BABGI|nr:DnaJ subfamily C member protein 2 [Babesia gibsoni]
MVAHQPLALPNAAYNADQPVVFKAAIATRRVENAGFALFLAREWMLEVSYSNVFNPAQNIDISTDTRHVVEEFLQGGHVEGFNAQHVYSHKREWAQLLSLVSQHPVAGNCKEDETEDVGRISRGSSKKCLGLVRDFLGKNQNAYELLNVRESDDVTKIKASYKKIVLLLHPDKASNTRVPVEFEEYAVKYRLRSLCDEERRQQFILLQDAFTILSDSDLRHEYDCSLPFDESIPSKEDAKEAADFFALFLPVFDLNARWSRTKPVPSLGTANSSDQEVDAFYDFWRGFETTRTFSHAAPHLLDDAESREEKRWMERENQKVQKKLVKKELVRIQKLVDLAQAYDPRIKARAERKRLEKEERQRLMEEQRLRELRNKQEEEERRRNEVEQSQMRERFEKQIVKKLRQHLRSISGKLVNGVQLSQHFDRLSELEYDFVKESCQEVYSLLGHATVIEGSDESLQFVKRMDSIVKAAVIDESTPFEEVIKRVSLRLSPATEGVSEISTPKEKQQKEETTVIWTKEELSRLSKAVELHVAGVSNRWSLIAKYVKTKTAPQCIQAAREMAAGKTVPISLSSNTGDVWTAEEQSSLEYALAKYPASLEPATRWRMIASEVKGKTPKECLARFKMIKATIAAATKNETERN